MTGPTFALLVALFVGAVVAVTHFVPQALARHRRPGRMIAFEQRARFDYERARLLSPNERVTWDAEAARRARRGL
jgi:hypothetical protein